MTLNFKSPTPNRKYLDLTAIAAELTAHLGQWAVVDKGIETRMRGKAGQYRRRPPLAFSDGVYEFTVRVTKPKSGKARLYARRVS